MKSVTACFVSLLLVAGTALGQMGHNGHDLDENLIFPHFVLGSGFTTQLVLMNPQPGIPVTGTLYFFNRDGSALQVVNNSQTVSQVNVAIPAGGVTFINVTGTDATLVIGWALLDVNRGSSQNDPRTRVSGSVIFTNTEGGTTLGSVGVVAANYEMGKHKRIAIPVTVQGNAVNTGIALVDAGDQPIDVNFELRDTQGAVVRNAATINPPISPLASGQQTSLFVTELFPDFDFNNQDFQGLLLLSTDQEGLEAVGLLTNNLLLTSIPVVRFVPAVVSNPQTAQVINQGFTFSPSEVTITVGDSVHWTLESIHDVAEVTQATWDANGNTRKAGGFSTPFGGGTVQFNTPGTYYYVCEPHASLGMKGKVIVNPAG